MTQGYTNQIPIPLPVSKGGTGGTSSTGSGNVVLANSPTISTPDLVGVIDASNAAAGSVGQVISSTISSGSAVSFSNGIDKDVTSITLTAGDWDVFGNVTFISSGGTTLTYAWCSLTSATRPDSSLYAEATGSSAMCTPYLRVNVTVNTTVYLSGRATIGSGTCTGAGGIYARRVR